MDAFVSQYLQTALWSSSNLDSGKPLSDAYTIADIHPVTLEMAVKDCDLFRQQAGDLLDGIDDEQAGYDFWLTRNHHGAGFWDRGLGEIGEKLTKLSHQFGSVDLYPGTDNKIHEA
jgi:hypothetical protein